MYYIIIIISNQLKQFVFKIQVEMITCAVLYQLNMLIEMNWQINANINNVVQPIVIREIKFQELLICSIYIHDIITEIH